MVFLCIVVVYDGDAVTIFANLREELRVRMHVRFRAKICGCGIASPSYTTSVLVRLFVALQKIHGKVVMSFLEGLAMSHSELLRIDCTGSLEMFGK